MIVPDTDGFVPSVKTALLEQDLAHQGALILLSVQSASDDWSKIACVKTAMQVQLPSTELEIM